MGVSTDRGSPDEYEVVWRNGHTDRVFAHQVSWSGGSGFLQLAEPGPRRIRFHAEVGGHWRLLLDALEDDIATVRNVTQVGL